ncbi:Ferrichrome receptor FcuA precursor [Aliarcobacter thereius]|uniref:TonB-dependent receptor n=1 Tax=Aliarcobacter thereius TaxID=544718 RepID=A0A5R9HA68_9BACT|nr:TonB-dependent receptor [Aliarcobacter thereius]OCL85237.1 Ferrichrome receptor FcuA precursor [Aliarcobacter thereius]OCL87857.1 Ferrichrome receptor FcuA precursor [Aliarcobacter thereius]TLS72973.1 TonB-dependent receptor [Aliarcobacter thereius]TLT08385.1 TonB-dependent receptor [Aliarcobacter thereius]
MKRYIISSVTALFISTNTFADDISYSLEKQSLKNAIEAISKKANKQYLVDSSLLNGKSSNEIKNIKGTNNALIEVLKDSGLIFSIEDNVIIIKSRKTIENGTLLDEISVNTGKNGDSEVGYLVEDIKGIGVWGQRSLQDTPYTMSVISKDLIQNVQANDMSQIFKMNPITQDGGDQNGGNYKTVIRGFDSNNAVINGLPLADWNSFVVMEDLERVETISGATGFLYGGGRVGGAVNYITKKPTLENKRSIKIGNYGGEQYYGHIDLSGQIDEENIFGYRINALYQDGDSVADVGKEQKFVSLAFDYKPTDNFTLDLNYSHRELKRTKIKPVISIVNNSFRPNLDVSKGYTPDWLLTDEENDRLISNIKWDINDTFTLRSSFLYEEAERIMPAGQTILTRTDGLYDLIQFKYSTQTNEFKNYSGNIYLDNKFKTFGINHLLTIGYSESYSKSLFPKDFYRMEYLPGKDLNEIKNSDIPSVVIPNSNKIHYNPILQYKNILIGDDIVFNEQWSALIGANYATIIQKDYKNEVKVSTYEKSALTPTLSLMYKPFEDITTYITYIESLEQGTVVGTNYSNAGEVLDPLVSKQYEIGAKYSLFDEKALLTASLFRIEKSNQYSDNATPMPKYIQDGKQIHQGVEFIFSGKITDNLTLFGGGALMDIKIKEAEDKQIEGKKPTNAASKMAKLYAEYDIPMIKGLTISGGAYYTGEKYGNELNTDKIPSYTLYDAGLRYKTKLDKYPTTFLLNVSNITGEDYWASSNFLGDPRSVAFSMKMDF